MNIKSEKNFGNKTRVFDLFGEIVFVISIPLALYFICTDFLSSGIDNYFHKSKMGFAETLESHVKIEDREKFRKYVKEFRK